MSKNKNEDLPETDINVQRGPVRTDLHCTECGQNFIAELDFSIDGNHVVECPFCLHEHWRVIKNGRVTSDRHGSGPATVRVPRKRVWKHNVLQIKTSSAAMFLRDRWLNRSDGE